MMDTSFEYTCDCGNKSFYMGKGDYKHIVMCVKCRSVYNTWRPNKPLMVFDDREMGTFNIHIGVNE